MKTLIKFSALNLTSTSKGSPSIPLYVTANLVFTDNYNSLELSADPLIKDVNFHSKQK